MKGSNASCKHATSWDDEQDVGVLGNKLLVKFLSLNTPVHSGNSFQTKICVAKLDSAASQHYFIEK